MAPQGRTVAAQKSDGSTLGWIKESLQDSFERLQKRGQPELDLTNGNLTIQKRPLNSRPVSVLTFDRFQQRTAAKGARVKDKQNYALGLIEHSSAAAPSARFRAGGPRWLAIQRDSE